MQTHTNNEIALTLGELYRGLLETLIMCDNQQIPVVLLTREYGERASYIVAWQGIPRTTVMPTTNGENELWQVEIVQGNNVVFDYTFGDNDTSTLIGVLVENIDSDVIYIDTTVVQPPTE